MDGALDAGIETFVPEGRAETSEASFAAFYEQSFTDVVRAVAAFCGNLDMAQEATQEAFSRAFARWRRLKDEPWVAGWVTTTAMNVCRRQARRSARLMQLVAEVSADGPSLQRLELLQAVQSLPVRQRQAFVLHHIAGYPVADVAHLLKISEGSVKTHLARARARLQRAFEEGVDR